MCVRLCCDAALTVIDNRSAPRNPCGSVPLPPPPVSNPFEALRRSPLTYSGVCDVFTVACADRSTFSIVSADGRAGVTSAATTVLQREVPSALGDTIPPQLRGHQG